MTTPTKICTICELPKDRTEFPKHGGHRDGLGSNCRPCVKERARMRRLNIPRTPKPPKTLKVKKIKAPVDPELIVDCPGIWEIEHRGRSTRTFNFTSLIDNSTFSFPSFREARKARTEMMDAFRGQAVFESVHRQTTGKKPAVDDEGDE